MRRSQWRLWSSSSVCGVALVQLYGQGLACANPLARLVYVRGQGAEQCPEPMALRVAVVARLGYDPFSATASKIVLVGIEKKGGELRARVDLANAEGSIQGVRELSAPLEHCFDLIRAMALSVSIAIDPAGALARR